MSEVVREGLRLLEDREARRARALLEIEHVVRDGIDSGPADSLDLDAVVAEAEQRAEAAFYKLKAELGAAADELEAGGGMPFDPRTFEPRAFT